MHAFPLFTQFQSKFAFYQHHSLLVGLSGGVDSVVLLHLLKTWREVNPSLQLRAIHVHHGISSNADSWLEFCQQLCASWEIEFVGEKIQLPSKGNLEHNARYKRYEAVAKNLRAKEVLVTAHHRDDQVETFFLALKRGSGLAGLGAMREFSTLKLSDLNPIPVVRPLLSFSRLQIETYATEQGLSWITDESNFNTDYDRNFLRHTVLPILRKRWEHFDANIARTAEICQGEQCLIEEFLTKDIFQHQSSELEKNFPQFGGDTLALEYIINASEAKQNVVLRWYLQQHQIIPTYKQLEQIKQDVLRASHEANPAFKLRDKVVRRYQNKLYITPIFQDVSNFEAVLEAEQWQELPDNLGKIMLQQSDQNLQIVWEKFNGEKMCENLPLSLFLTTNQIKVKFRYTGKVRLKNGMQESLKKCWQKSHTSPWERNRIPMIFSGDKFILAMGKFRNFEEF